MAQHDSGYKLLFSHPRMVEDLLRGFVHEPWVENLDYGSLEPAETTFTSADLRQRHSDRVWRIRWRGSRRGWLYLYVLLEFQSTPDRFMAVRLLGYVALLLADLSRSKDARSRGLPAVLPIVLYNGKRAWTASTDLASLYGAVPPGTERYLPQMSYLLIDESRLRPEELALPDNRVASLIRLETCAPEELPDLTAQLAALLPPGKESELREHFTTWLKQLLRRLRRPGVTIPVIAGLEEIAMLEETLSEWLNGAKREGRVEGRAEGRQEGRAEGRQEGEIAGMRRLLLQQLEQRFGALPLGVRRRVRAITSPEELGGLAKRVLVAGSLAEMGLVGRRKRAS